MDAHIRRKIIAALNAEREAAQASLDSIRRLKAQILMDEERASQRLNESIRRVAVVATLIKEAEE